MSHGVIKQIADILTDTTFQKANESVRITGRLESFNSSDETLILSFQGASIVVDTKKLALEHLELHIGSMYQFLGEVYKHSTGEIRLNARLGRNVDGLDIELFLQAIELRNQFLAKKTNG